MLDLLFILFLFLLNSYLSIIFYLNKNLLFFYTFL